VWHIANDKFFPNVLIKTFIGQAANGQIAGHCFFCSCRSQFALQLFCRAKTSLGNASDFLPLETFAAQSD
jgi:hypothetical protein